MDRRGFAANLGGWLLSVGAAIATFFHEGPLDEVESEPVLALPGDATIIELEQAVLRYDPLEASICLDVKLAGSDNPEGTVAVFDGESIPDLEACDRPLPMVFTGCRLVRWEDMQPGGRYLRVGGPDDMSEFFFRKWKDGVLVQGSRVAICDPIFSSTNPA